MDVFPPNYNTSLHLREYYRELHPVVDYLISAKSHNFTSDE